jgi:hypothetical protein
VACEGETPSFAQKAKNWRRALSYFAYVEGARELLSRVTAINPSVSVPKRDRYVSAIEEDRGA